MKEYIDALDKITQTEVLDEAGNISSTIAIKKQNDVIKFGKDALRLRLQDRKLDDKLNAIARQNGALAGLMLINIAVSGDKSFMGNIAQGLSVRGL